MFDRFKRLRVLRCCYDKRYIRIICSLLDTVNIPKKLVIQIRGVNCVYKLAMSKILDGSFSNMLTFHDGQSDCFVTDTFVPGYSAEEELIRLLGFASIKKIRDFISKTSSQPINMHYLTFMLKTPLLEAIRRDDVSILALLIEKIPVCLNDTMTQPYGRTALMRAAYDSRNPEMLQLLIKKGADISKLDARGWTCLQYAVVGGRLKNVEVLLDFSLDVDVRDFDDRTPLMISVLYSNLDVLSLLLKRGANVTARDKRGFTALQLAVLRKKRDAAIILIKKGSDVNLLMPLTKISLRKLSDVTLPKLLPCIQYEEDVFEDFEDQELS